MSLHFYHEIGHALIAHIFDGHLTHFNGVTFDPTEVGATNLNARDLGYTKTAPAAHIEDLYREERHTSAIIDGLILLGGVAGASFLPPSDERCFVRITPKNFMSALKVRGADGDFEIIARGRRPYGRYIIETGHDTDSSILLHCRILNLLQEIFISQVVITASTELYKLLSEREPNILSADDFKNVLNEESTTALRKEIREKISFVNFGSIAPEPSED